MTPEKLGLAYLKLTSAYSSDDIQESRNTKMVFIRAIAEISF